MFPAHGWISGMVPIHEHKPGCYAPENLLIKFSIFNRRILPAAILQFTIAFN